MKNFVNILAVIAASAALISARALPQAQGIAVGDIFYAANAIEARIPRNGKSASELYFGNTPSKDC